jgi:hypothetical protein
MSRLTRVLSAAAAALRLVEARATSRWVARVEQSLVVR